MLSARQLVYFLGLLEAKKQAAAEKGTDSVRIADILEMLADACEQEQDRLAGGGYGRENDG